MNFDWDFVRVVRTEALIVIWKTTFIFDKYRGNLTVRWHLSNVNMIFDILNIHNVEINERSSISSLNKLR